jgi:hypothetical protein
VTPCSVAAGYQCISVSNDLAALIPEDSNLKRLSMFRNIVLRRIFGHPGEKYH